LSSQSDLGSLDTNGQGKWQLAGVRWLLPAGWLLAALGFFGPWIAHPTAALSLSGSDMAEFVKFLPAFLDGSLRLLRQLFYLPPFAVAVSIALLIGLDSLRYSRFVRAVALLLAVPVSLQLLPPAWSPASLIGSEFRAQTLALGVCWLLLACFWLYERLPAWLLGSVSAVLCLLAIFLPGWQFVTAKPAIDEVYSMPLSPGWGIVLCFIGLAIVALGSTILALSTRSQRIGRRASA
jgi:hypothetical protein